MQKSNRHSYTGSYHSGRRHHLQPPSLVHRQLGRADFVMAVHSSFFISVRKPGGPFLVCSPRTARHCAAKEITRGSGSAAISITVAVPAVMAVEVTTIEPPRSSVRPVVTTVPPALAAAIIVAGAELAPLVELPHAPAHGIGPCGKGRHRNDHRGHADGKCKGFHVVLLGSRPCRTNTISLRGVPVK